MQAIEFSLSSQVYNQSGSVESQCNGIVFINIGTDTVKIMDYPIISGSSFAPPCNVGEKDTTRYICQFANLTTDQRLLVIRKNYINR